MATSPSPLPFSTDATYHHPFPFGFYPAYAPDPNFSPPPCGFGAPAPGFFPYAAAYAPPPGFFPAPPPGFFPGAATQPTTVPPASTRIPTSCFHPPIQNPPNWPPPATDLTPTTAPVRHPDRVPSFPLLSGRSGLTPQMLDAVPTPSNRERRSSHSHVSFTSSATTTPAPTSTPHADLSSSKAAFASSNCSSMGSSSPTSASVLTDCAPVAIKVRRYLAHDGADPASANRMQPDCAPVSLADLAPQHKLQPHAAAHRSLLDIGRRWDEHHSQLQCSLASVQGQLSKLVDRLSSLTNSMVSSSTSSTTTAPTPSSGSTTKLFGEMPRPRYCPRKYSSPLHYYEEQETPALSPFVSEGNNNLSEQNIDGMPQSYGFSNLNRRSVFRADGTEHSYYALPEDYPLERAVPEPVFALHDEKTEGDSNDSVGVFSSNPGQQPYEEEQQEGEQLLKCLSKTQETEHTSACLNITSDVRDFTLEMQKQDDERVCSFPVTKASDSSATRSSQLSIEHSMRELRLLWDPGALASLHSNKGNLYNQVDTYGISTDLGFTFSEDTVAIDCYITPTNTCLSAMRLVDLLLDYSQGHGAENKQTVQWDPGLQISELATWQSTIFPWYKSKWWLLFPEEKIKVGLILQQWSSCVNVLPYCQNFQICNVVSSQLLLQSHSCSTEAIHSAISMSNATTVHMILVLSSGKIAEEEKDAAAVYQVFEIQFPMSKASHIWDPGIVSILFLYKGLHVHKIQLVHYSAIHAGYFFAPARLLPTQIPTHAPNNTELGEFTSRCLSLRQQGVKKSYNAKNLLSSPNYLHILEMEILFITFLPP